MVVEEVFAVIAEGTRRDILEALAKEHKAVGQLVEELGVSQPTVSKHLRVLREAGVVTMRAQGQKRFYSINTQPLLLVSEWLDGLGAGIWRGAPRTAAAARNGAPSSAPAVDTGGGRLPPAAAAAPVVPPDSIPTPERHPQPAAAVATTANAQLAVVVAAGDHDPSMQQQITRTVGRAATKAADLLANLPAFRRRRD